MTETTKTSPFSDEELKRVAKQKVLMKFALKIHVAAYVGVNIALLAINYLTNGLSTIWFVYPLAGWFIGLVAHAVAYTIYARGVTGGGRIGILFNASIYAASMPALLAINYFSSPAFPWVLWPAVFWLLGVTIQTVAVKKAGSPKVKKAPKQSWLDRGVEKEMEKARRIRGGN